MDLPIACTGHRRTALSAFHIPGSERQPTAGPLHISILFISDPADSGTFWEHSYRASNRHSIRMPRQAGARAKSRSGRLDAASPICRPRGRPRRNSVPSAPPVTLSSGTTDHADTAGSPVGQPDRAAPTGSATRTAVGVGGESNLCSPTSPASHRVTSASDGLTVSSTYSRPNNVSYSPINACVVNNDPIVSSPNVDAAGRDNASNGLSLNAMGSPRGLFTAGAVPADRGSGVPLHAQDNSFTSAVVESRDIDIEAERPTPMPTFNVNAPLGLHVPSHIKEKIWNGQYVEMATLYRENSMSAVRDKGTALTMALEEGKVVFKPAAAQTKKLDSLEKWMSAFHTFIAIFSSRHPNRTSELLKYAETVRVAAQQFPGYGWRNYDEQFRLRQEAFPNRSWAQIDMELWVTVAAAASISPASFSGSPSNLKSSEGKSVCFAFNGARGCRWNSCKFQHRCSRCSQFGHNALSCRLNQNSLPTRSSRGGEGRSRAFSKSTNAAPNDRAQAGQRAHVYNANNSTLGKQGSSAGRTMSNNFRPPNTN